MYFFVKTHDKLRKFAKTFHVHNICKKTNGQEDKWALKMLNKINENKNSKYIYGERE